MEESLRLAFHIRKDRAAALRHMDLVFELFPRLKERIDQPAGQRFGFGGIEAAFAFGLSRRAQRRHGEVLVFGTVRRRGEVWALTAEEGDLVGEEAARRGDVDEVAAWARAALERISAEGG